MILPPWTQRRGPLGSRSRGVKVVTGACRSGCSSRRGRQRGPWCKEQKTLEFMYFYQLTIRMYIRICWRATGRLHTKSSCILHTLDRAKAWEYAWADALLWASLRPQRGPVYYFPLMLSGGKKEEILSWVPKASRGGRKQF